MKDSFSADAKAHAYDIQMLSVRGNEMKVCLRTGCCMLAECSLSGSMHQVFYKVSPYHIWMCTTCVNIKPEFEAVFEELLE